jgi:hypothetical protein
MDLLAVKAGLTLPNSNGPIEGASAKVKYLKQQIYGISQTRTTTGFCARPVRLQTLPGGGPALPDRVTDV